MKNDLVGQTFGKLTVIEDTGERNSSRQIKWLCKCECGNTRIAIAPYLKSGKVYCCSQCAKKDKTPAPRKIKNDLTDQRFGRLTVLYPTDKRTSDRCIIWHCKCDCGNETDVSSKSLKQGNTKSCGCLNTETRAALGRSHKKDLTGQVFGKLTVLEDSGQRQDNNILWKCQCECGNQPLIKGTALLHGVKSCGCLKSKGEARIAELLSENNISFETQKTFDDCLFPDTNYHAYFDFWVDNKYLIEYDGIQHFKPSDNSKSWNTEQNMIETKKRDEFKNEWCKKKGISLIRIPYTKLKNLTIEDLKP